MKNRKSPKAAERVIWATGLKQALVVDDAIVATTDKRVSIYKLAKSLGVTLLDGDSIYRIKNVDVLQNRARIDSFTIDKWVKDVDESRHSTDWRRAYFDARSSLLLGFGILSANRFLKSFSFFAEQALWSADSSEHAVVALRLVYICSALAAISLDFVVADHAFKTKEEMRQSLANGIRFGEPEAVNVIPHVHAAIGLARKYAENGAAVSKQIEYGFFTDADRIPAEIIGDYVTSLGDSEKLFSVARELEKEAHAAIPTPFDGLRPDARALLGVFLDFNGISREKFASVCKR